MRRIANILVETITQKLLTQLNASVNVSNYWIHIGVSHFFGGAASLIEDRTWLWSRTGEFLSATIS
jgi:hypothetical protein